MTTLQQELQSNNVTVATSGDPASGWLARVQQGCIAMGMQVSPAEPPAAGLRSGFNCANAGIELRGANLVAAGTQAPTIAPVAPVAPEQIAPAAPSASTPGLG